ncbi:hypothetical protein E4U43_007585 [Claviceps pusilla]|uniref:Uncharacterized protein n=1 Tax=Claviceps pusilla TaxID=123648 RepID=A0A9P7SY05_9HYPO|nr:hypothetical protein E4U43_007585 [Claviceps pusilla]
MTTHPDDLAGNHDLKSAQRKACHRRVIKPQHRALNRLVRANAKHLVESGQINVFPLCPEDHSQLDQDCLRNHIQRDLRNHYKHARNPPGNEHTPRKMDYQDQEDRELAYSDIPLPSDRYRFVRRPTLGREDAFRDASTSRGRVHVRRRPEPGNDNGGGGGDDEDQQVARLYHMGLLYDYTEQDQRSDGFNLNSIRHDEPLYSIRPAKRERKRSKAGSGFNRHLHLDLSFSDLGDDEALAQYLMSLNGAEKADKDGNNADTDASTGADVIHPPSRDAAESRSQPPLRVLYELATSPSPADLDATQPPDLVTDFLSDYDCFSDGELDDTPSQREVQEDADSTPSDAWVMLGDGS